MGLAAGAVQRAAPVAADPALIDSTATGCSGRPRAKSVPAALDSARRAGHLRVRQAGGLDRAAAPKAPAALAPASDEPSRRGGRTIDHSRGARQAGSGAVLRASHPVLGTRTVARPGADRRRAGSPSGDRRSARRASGDRRSARNANGSPANADRRRGAPRIDVPPTNARPVEQMIRARRSSARRVGDPADREGDPSRAALRGRPSAPFPAIVHPTRRSSSWQPGKSSLPAGVRSRKPSRPVARLFGCWSFHSVARRSNGSSSTRRRCVSRSWRSKAAH